MSRVDVREGETGEEASPASSTSRDRTVLALGTTPTVQRTMIFSELEAGEVNRAARVLEFASGKPINVARVLGQLGQRVCFVGPVGGSRGNFVRSELRRLGLDAELLDVPGQTRQCVTVIDQTRRQATELVEEAPSLPEETGEQLLAVLARRLEQSSMVVMSGSLAEGVDADFYARAVGVCESAGVPTIVDARGQALRLAIEAKPTVVKPNRAELAATIGRGVDSRRALHDALRSMAKAGAKYVVCTRGRDGAVASDGERVWSISAPSVDVISPIGSGDAFAAGLAAALVRGAAMPEACRLASACGASNAAQSAAGNVDPEQVQAWVSRVEISEEP